MSEMELLHKMLTEEGIEHTYAPRNLGISEMGIDVMQVIAYDQNHKRLWNAVCGIGTYGYREGLLEVMGTIVPEKDGVIGWLTAQDVMDLVHSEAEGEAIK